MIVEIPDDNSIVKWKTNDKDDWKSAEISDLIKVYEGRQKGECCGSCYLCDVGDCGAEMKGDKE